MNVKTIRLLNRNKDVMKVLFKPVQRVVIDKLDRGRPLDENEKRYLRGNLGKRIGAVDILLDRSEEQVTHSILSHIPGSYITGYEALKHNGFGWYYDTNVITVMNTRIQGTMKEHGRRIRFVRVRSMADREFTTDERTELRYATNAQVMLDARTLRDNALIRTCGSMLDRYGEMFIEGA